MPKYGCNRPVAPVWPEPRGQHVQDGWNDDGTRRVVWLPSKITDEDCHHFERLTDTDCAGCWQCK